MALAKRQRGKSPWKWNKSKSMDQSENLRWNKYTLFLTSLICIGQAQCGGDKTYEKKEVKTDWDLSFEVGPPLCLTSLCFSGSVKSDSLRPHGLQHARLPCLSPTPRACSNSCQLNGDAIQPSHPLSSPSPAPSLSQNQGIFQWVSSLHQMAKILEFQLQHLSFQWIVRTDFL